MYKCAIIGVSGRRASQLADAYQHISRGRLVAVSARQADKLHAFADTYGVPERYTDYREMFEQARPDLVHVNTPPTVRLEVMAAAEAAGVPALLVEKPLAVQGEDYAAIRDFAQKMRVKAAINHQLHFHRQRQALQRFVQEGRIGEVRFVEASAGMNLAYQGTHSLQAIGAFNPGAAPTSVFAQAAGTDGLQVTPGQHFAPDQCLAGISYANGVSGLLRCGANAPRVGDGPVYMHKRVAAYGTRGFVQWTMHFWETSSDGVTTRDSLDYWPEDVLAQAAMTEAMFDWLEDDAALHPLNMQTALSDFDIILGIYMSTLRHQPIALPVQPEPDLIARLRRHLDQADGPISRSGQSALS